MRGLFRKLRNSVLFTGKFSPKQLSGLVQWHTADTISGIANGGAITTWPDLSGRGNHLVQNTGGNKPTYVTGQVNGKPGVNFVRANSQNMNGPLINIPQPVTTFVVAKVLSAGAASGQVMVTSPSGGQNAMLLDTTGHFAIYNGAALRTSALTYFDDWHIFEQTAQATDNAWVDGASVITLESGSDNFGGLRVGMDQASAQTLSGVILEIIVYSRALTTTERNQVRGYINKKYALNGVLPFSLKFPYFIFDDGNLHNNTTFAQMLTDVKALGLDSVMLTNCNIDMCEGFLPVSDQRQMPAFMGPLSEVTNNLAVSLNTFASKLKRHPSAVGIYILDEPDASLAAQIKTLVDNYTALDPDRPLYPVLVGDDRVDPIYTTAYPRLFVQDVYPCAAGHSEMDFTMAGFGYSYDIEEYYLRTMRSKKPGIPLIIIGQLHNTSDVNGPVLRVPTVPEIRRQVWEAIGAGAQGFGWFIWTSQQGWTGLKDAPTFQTAVAAIASQDLTPAAKVILATTERATDEWAGTNGAKVKTRCDLNGAKTDPGPNRYVAAWNPTTASITTVLSRKDGISTQLTKVNDGSIVPSNTVTLGPGLGFLFKAAPIPATGVPNIPLNFNLTPEQWWDAHPFNPDHGTYVVVSPPTFLSLAAGDSIDEALARLPISGGTLILAPGHYAGFKIFKSNVHIVCPSGYAYIDCPAVPSSYKQQVVYIGPAYEAIVPSTAYADFNAGVDRAFTTSIAAAQPWWTYIQNPVHNIYLQNLRFQGGGNKIICPVACTDVKDILFDGCIWENMMSSADIFAIDPVDGFHYGSLSSNVNNKNVIFRNCQFLGNGRWCTYVDGGHGVTYVGCTIAGSAYGSGAFLGLTNDDFSYDLDLNGITSLDEQKSARYEVVAHCNFTGSINECVDYSGGELLVVDNTINQVYIFVRTTGRGSNKFATAGMIYHHDRNTVLRNTIGTVTAGPLNGNQGILWMGAVHAAINWYPNNPEWYGTLGQYQIRDNVVTTGPAGLVAAAHEEYTDITKPLVLVEGPNVISGNTKNGGTPLTGFSNV